MVEDPFYTDSLSCGSLTDRRTRHRLSELLEAVIEGDTGARISVANLLLVMRDRAFGALIFMFAVPNIFPVVIPGTSAILGLPLIYLSAQLMLGYPLPVFPDWISSRSINRADVSAMARRLIPQLVRAERLLKPRLAWLTGPTAERAIGGTCLILSIILFLPIPLGNILPAVAISLLALGVLEADGIVVLAGTTMAVVSLVVVAGVLYGLAKAAFFILKSTTAYPVGSAVYNIW